MINIHVHICCISYQGVGEEERERNERQHEMKTRSMCVYTLRVSGIVKILGADFRYAAIYASKEILHSTSVNSPLKVYSEYRIRYIGHINYCRQP